MSTNKVIPPMTELSDPPSYIFSLFLIQNRSWMLEAVFQMKFSFFTAEKKNKNVYCMRGIHLGLSEPEFKGDLVFKFKKLI